MRLCSQHKQAILFSAQRRPNPFKLSKVSDNGVSSKDLHHVENAEEQYIYHKHVLKLEENVWSQP